MIRPIVAELYFPEHIIKSPSILKTPLGDKEVLGKVTIPAFPEFKVNKNIEFTLFPFSDYFDGIIGLEELRRLKLTMDFQNQCLYNEKTQIPFDYRKSCTQNHFTIEIPARSTLQQRFPVDIQEGEISIPEIRYNEIWIPETVAIARNFKAVFEIQNTSDKTICYTFFEPFHATHLQTDEVEIYNFENFIPTYNINNPQEAETNLLHKIRTQHMNSEERQAIHKLISKFSHLFHDNNSQLTFTNKVKHEIKTSDEIPVHTKTYRFPFCHKQEVNSQINKMLEDGIIRHSQSPWSSPIWIVPKKADASGQKKWRIVVDYRKVNEKTLNDRYPLPNIEDLLDKLGKCNYFTTLDLASGFHQIEMHQDSIQKTAFNVENGHYEYLRMPFGLKNAPATFQRVMDHVLKDIQNKICLVYMDDIIIFSTSLQEHISNLKQVFQRLSDAKLKIQLDKSEFLRQNVEFLGHIITPSGIKPNPKKIEAISKFPIPKTTREIKSFLGLLGFYRKFIKDFAKITKPLTHCLKKNVKIVHNDPFIKAFETCKTILSNQPLLQYPDFEQPFILTTDASGYSIGAVLSQGPIGRDKPIAYASRTLNDAERNYSVIERELLSIVNFTKYFRPYLFGRKFTIITDHKPLQWVNNLKEPNSRLMRWRLKLLEYDYDIVYRKGSENKVADALSRIEIHPIENQSVIGNPDENTNRLFDDFPELTAEDLAELELSPSPAYTPSETTKQTEKPDVATNAGAKRNKETGNKVKVLSDIELAPARPITSNETIHSAIENPILEIPISECPINTFHNQIIVTFTKDTERTYVKTRKLHNTKTRYEVTFPNRYKEILTDEIIKFFRDYIRPKTLYGILIDQRETNELIPILQKHFNKNSFKLIQTNQYRTDLTKPSEIEAAIKNHHVNKTGHSGIVETTKAIRQNYYWPNIGTDVRNFINTCEKCQTSKYERRPNKIILQNTPIGEKPFEHIYIDTFQIENRKFLTIIDSFSRFAQAYPTTQNAAEIVNNLLKFMSHYGLPTKITCDGGAEFKNQLLEEFLKGYGINIHYTTPYNPNSNSPVERLHSTLLEKYRALSKENIQDKSPETIMNLTLLAYNNTIHSATRYTPFQIIKGNLEIKTAFELTDHHIINDYLNKQAINMKLIAEHVRENNEKKRDLTKVNLDRDDPIKDYSNEQQYVKTPPRGPKHKPRYTPVELIEDLGDKLLTSRGTFHKAQIKPNRKITKNKQFVSDENNQPSTSNATADTGTNNN